MSGRLLPSASLPRHRQGRRTAVVCARPWIATLGGCKTGETRLGSILSPPSSRLHGRPPSLGRSSFPGPVRPLFP
jgi:hypothetical protein